MRRVLALLALAFAAAAHAGEPAASIDAFIARELPASGAPGLAYAIVENGEIRSGVRGEIVAGSGRAIVPETPFLLGSISKSFTAMAVLQLVEAGKVDLDAGIARYLEVFARQPSGAITVRQLLGHTSGYSTLQGNAVFAGPAAGPRALMQQAERVAQWAPAHAPGTHWEYSNANYQVLGALIEAVSGQDYASYVAANILRPIGMTHSFVADGQSHDEMARGHLPWFGTKRPLELGRTDPVTAPQGGVIASAGDLALYLAVMMNGVDDVISAGSKAAMLRPASAVAPYYGFGWFIDAGRGTVFHAGSSPGTETLATMVPAERRGVVVLVNAGSGTGFGETGRLRDGITARALGRADVGEQSHLQQQALCVALVLLPVVFLASMVWAWFHRRALRAKSGLFGTFSLWFPLVTTLAAAGFIFLVIPQIFGLSVPALGLFQPDLALALAATAITGVMWAVLRLAIAYGGARRG